MIKSITVKNYLDESVNIELTRPEKSGFIIRNIEGLGPAKANINTTDISLNDGSMYNSSRLDNRNITFDLLFYQTDTETIEDIRQKSYKYFPIKKKVTLTVETDNNTLVTEGYVESNEPEIFSETEGSNISIICTDPYFHELEDDYTVFSGVESLFEFPFENEPEYDEEGKIIPSLEMGRLQIKTENTVFYEGYGEVGVSIYIHALGTATNLTIINIDTREKLVINTDKLKQMTGSTIVAGDNITIHTHKGNKSITLLRDGVTTNILNCREKGSKWFTLKKGDNLFAYTAETGATNLQFTICNRNAYDGV